MPSKNSNTKKKTRKKSREELNERLAIRTVQIIGFGFAVFLTGFKLWSPQADIPWWVVFGFFGFGASADFAFLRNIGGIGGRRK